MKPEDHSQEIIRIADEVSAYLKDELKGHDTFTITDIEMIVLLAVTKGYEAAMDKK